MSSPYSWRRVEIELNGQKEFVPLSTNALMKHLRTSDVKIGGFLERTRVVSICNAMITMK